jgi:hypothetical protein
VPKNSLFLNYDPAFWGSISGWVSGLLTFLTVAVGVWAIWSSNRQFHKELAQREKTRQREEADKIEEERTQVRNSAGSVFSWIAVEKNTSRTRIEEIYLVVTNLTLAPIYEWKISSENRFFSVGHEDFGIIIPGAQKFNLSEALDDTDWAGSDIPRVSIAFSAVNGESLVRGFNGMLALAGN